MFSLLRKASLLYKTSKIVFSPFIFAIYDICINGVTGAYKGLQGVTRGYKGLQGVTGGFKGLHLVTRDDIGLQGIIQTFFDLELSQILFLGLFSLKIKVEEISNF